MRLIFDMDGTLADFEGAGGLSKMSEQGFFRNLKPYPKTISTIKRLYKSGSQIFILSACIGTDYCEQEKLEWIQEYLPFLPKENILLVPYGTVKAKAFQEQYRIKITKNDVLFDDYKVNLKEWIQAGGTSVKCGKSYKPNREYPQMVRFANIGEIIKNAWQVAGDRL